MSKLDLALAHIAKGSTYSWDLTTLLGLGIPISAPLRQKLLASATTPEDADHIRKLAQREQKNGRG